MNNFEIDISKRQMIALKILEDKITNEILFGGGAGGGKSFLGCLWIVIQAIKYPYTRWLIGRSVLKTLKETTIKTLFEVLSILNIPSNRYKYNAQTNELIFDNKSEIIFKDLFSYPSDPNFDELGSLEITGAFIDEAIQVKEKAKNIVKSRIRFKLDEYNLIPKMLYTSNPGKGWLYKEFYLPAKNNTLPENKKFVQSLLTDNPYISEYYAENLQTLDKESKERLLHGNWDYEQEGYVYDENKINYFDINDIDIENNLIVSYADISDGGGDYYCFIVACLINEKCYVIDIIYTQKDSNYWMPLTIEKIKQYNISKCIFESNNQGLMATKRIKDNIGESYKNRISAIPNTSNKHTRITIQAEINIIPLFYFLKIKSKMYTEAMEHLFQYRFDKTFKIDDFPDALAGLSKMQTILISKK